MKKLLASKSFLTVMSILSVLFGFALLCGGALALLHSLDVFSFPQGEETTLMSEDTVAEAFPIYTKEPQTAERVIPEDMIPKALIAEMPLTDSYYIKMRISSSEHEEKYTEGVYELWCSGDRFRLHRYHPTWQGVEYTVICDGNRIQITDFTEPSIEYAAFSSEYNLKSLAPLPDFKSLFAEKHRFTFYEESDEMISFSCEYPIWDFTDRVELSKETGLLASYSRSRGKVLLYSLEIIAAEVMSVDDSYMFLDDMFSFE